MQTFYALAVNTQAPTQSFVLPTGLTPGGYYLLMYIDSGDIFPEPPANNVISSPITVLAPPT
jgi:hypothetical protein